MAQNQQAEYGKNPQLHFKRPRYVPKFPNNDRDPKQNVQKMIDESLSLSTIKRKKSRTKKDKKKKKKKKKKKRKKRRESSIKKSITKNQLQVAMAASNLIAICYGRESRK